MKKNANIRLVAEFRNDFTGELTSFGEAEGTCYFPLGKVTNEYLAQSVMALLDLSEHDLRGMTGIMFADNEYMGRIYMVNTHIVIDLTKKSGRPGRYTYTPDGLNRLTEEIRGRRGAGERFVEMRPAWDWK